MRILAAVTVALCTGIAAGVASPIPAPLPPEDIRKSFFDGQPFHAATPSGVAFKMVFSPDGTVMREPTGRDGVKGVGTWKLDAKGFCTTWKNSRPNCFVLVNTGANKWSVMKGSDVVAVWSR